MDLRWFSAGSRISSSRHGMGISDTVTLLDVLEHIQRVWSEDLSVLGGEWQCELESLPDPNGWSPYGGIDGHGKAPFVGVRKA